MAWVNHARCLHCGLRLPLYRKLTDGEFCSAAHRKAFQDDQSRLAMERLMETRELCLRATKVEETTGEIGPPLAAKVPLAPIGPIGETAGIVAVDPIAYELGADPRIPMHELHTMFPGLPIAESTPVQLLVRAARMLEQSVGGGRCGPLEPAADAVVLPAPPASPALGSLIAADQSIRPLSRFGAVDNVQDVSREPKAIPSPACTWLPLPGCAAGRAELAAPFPPPAGLRGLTLHPTPLVHGIWIESPCSLEPASAEVAVPEVAGLRRQFEISASLAPDSVALLKPTPLNAFSAPPPPAPASALSIGISYPPIPVRKRSSELRWKAGLARLPLRRPPLRHPIDTPANALPEIGVPKGVDWQPLSTAPAGVGRPAFHPGRQLPQPAFACKVAVPMSVAGSSEKPASMPGSAAPAAFAHTLAYPFVEQTPQRIGEELADGNSRLPINIREAFAQAGQVGRMRAILRNTRPSVALAAVLIPAFMLLALRLSTGHSGNQRQQARVQVNAKPGTVKRFMNARLTAVRTALQNRAGVELMDDFRTGLDNWETRGDEEVSWAYDQAGFVRPGLLALYRPSLAMADYELEFLGQIDRKALGWVYRASDMRNYHAAKLVMTRPGPLPTVSLVRYTVIKGKEGPRTEVVLPLNVRSDTIYRVRLDIRGSDFSLYIQNQLVQFWTDDRLRSGGVGFFNARGEQSGVRWVQVSHQYDTIGRLCAYFAPVALTTYNFQSTLGAGTE